MGDGLGYGKAPLERHPSLNFKENAGAAFRCRIEADALRIHQDETRIIAGGAEGRQRQQ